MDVIWQTATRAGETVGDEEEEMVAPAPARTSMMKCRRIDNLWPAELSRSGLNNPDGFEFNILRSWLLTFYGFSGRLPTIIN